MMMMTIGELARKAGVSRRTIRYYVEIGLLPAPEGTSRAAMYGSEHLHRLEMIRGLQARRLTLEEIREHLATEPPPHADEPPTAVLADERPPRDDLSNASEYLTHLRGSVPRSELRQRPFDAMNAAPREPLSPLPSWERGREPSTDSYVAEQWLRIPLSADIELHVKRKGGRMDRRLSKLIKEAKRILTEEEKK